MRTLTIEKKMSGTGTIHDIASDLQDRVIKFRGQAKYAVVLASYYGGRGYSTHATEESAVVAARKVRDYSYTVVDHNGTEYVADQYTARLIAK